MADVGDMDLVREFARDHSEAAFTELVRRRLNLVYSIALRSTDSEADAQDVTQVVFIILARKAAGLGERTILTGWLYKTTRFAAEKLRRANARRVAREQEAYMQSTLTEAETANAWRLLAPYLEEAMSRLGERDRTLVALRFYENKTGPEAAALLGMQEAAVHKRTARALEKLRLCFAQQGVALSAGAIVGAVSAHAVQAAPAGMMKTIQAVAVAKGGAAAGAALTLAQELLGAMAWAKATTAIMAIIVGVGLWLAIGTTAVTVKGFEAHRPQVWQNGFDMSLLDRLPRQATILPALRSRAKEITGWRAYHGMYLGLNESATFIIGAAYDVSPARVIAAVPVPEGSYDFICNTAKNQREALQQEIKKVFGVAGRREWIATNVLVLTIRNGNAAGLKRSSPANPGFSRSEGSMALNHQRLSVLVRVIENKLRTPVVDRTGLTGYFDMKWDDTPDGLKRAVLNDLGLELAPANERVECLVLDKAK